MIADHKGEVPVFVYILPFIAGIITSLFINFSFTPIAILTGVLSAAFILLNIFYLKLNINRISWLGGMMMHVILFLIGIITVLINNPRSKQTYFGNYKPTHFLVAIGNEPVLKGKYWHCTADVKEALDHQKTNEVSGKILLTILADPKQPLEYGDELMVIANNKPVSPPLNPAVFNYRKYLEYQNIFQQCFLYPGQYAVVRHNAGNQIITASLKLRQQMVQKIKANITDTTTSAVASTLILGYKADLSPDVLQWYSNTGTIHVLSVSGAHVAMVFIFISFAFNFLNGSRSGQWLKAILIIVLIWAYAMLTGFSPAVCRAALMLSFTVIGTTGYRHNNAVNLLAVSAFLLLLYDPLLINDVGFQLSYLAVLGLIVLQPVIYKWLKSSNKWINKLWYLLSASLAAQLITFPLSIYYFHQFPVYFLISNLFIILPSELILGAGLLAILLPQIPYFTKALFWVVEYTIRLMNYGLKLIEQQHYSSINKIWFTTAECLLIFIVIIAILYFSYSRQKQYLLVAFGGTLIVTVLICVKTIYLQNSSNILFYSLNKHSAISFKIGNSGILLTDLSVKDPLFKYNIQPALDSTGIAHIQTSKLDTALSAQNLKKSKEGLIQFNNQRLMILDSNSTAHHNLNEKLKVDYVYLTGNSHVKLNYIRSNFIYDKLIIDGTNSPQTIKKLTHDADSLKENYFVLKRNKALMLLSN